MNVLIVINSKYSKIFYKIKKENLEMYYDLARRRTKDFSVILTNLSQKSFNFAPDDVLVIRIVTLCGEFKDDANDKTHSWYHLVTKKKELDDKNPNTY